jgi:multiple sugar transport system permease protein
VTTVTAPGRAPGKRRAVPGVVWLFLLIPALVEIGMVFWPAINSFYLSFTEWNGLGAAKPVGLDNFRELASDDVFRGGAC